MKLQLAYTAELVYSSPPKDLPNVAAMYWLPIIRSHCDT